MSDHNKLLVGVRADNPGAYAYVGINRGPDSFLLFARGFFEASRKLMSSLVTGQGSADIVIYPALFVFRHGVELALKQLIRYSGAIAPDGSDPTAPGHRLAALWARARDLVAYSLERGHHDETAPLSPEEMDGVIAELAAIDAGGDAFRYPESKTGETHMPEVVNIHLPQLQGVMDRVAETFRIWCQGLQDEAAWYRAYRRGEVRHEGPGTGSDPPK